MTLLPLRLVSLQLLAAVKAVSPLAASRPQFLSDQTTHAGTAYLCDTYSPWPVTETLSYGFAIMRNKANCCKCYELVWRSGTPAAGKRMQVQVINIGVSSSRFQSMPGCPAFFGYSS